ncbi:amidophosphoribosyltransferase [Geosporobacter subterraneus DSM 17957]|uniref:Amidophosphoribosyltransferase n=1 Tax=Geosporobacter subterraneus DSM 17957 TaxID=1121919 RepID=A0A1M6LA64_9FIRM|nr:amidophosphoribosyltransferase [Geosporobacter subterraneus]SHJ68098.1 amidophosphoribosyltransferase [Geosporobacter subterraneus DSM 17957]
MYNTINLDKLKEECGVIGIYGPGEQQLSRMAYFGLHALQHRGQESAGIAVNQGGQITYYKEMGLVQEVFSDDIIERLQGDIAVGHVRYSTTGESYVINAQPLVVRYKGGSIALAHNGNLINAGEIRDELEDQGVIFQTSIDSEVIANLIARYNAFGIEKAIQKTMGQIRGSYALVISYGDKLIGVRDPNGLRPLCIGKIDGGYVLSSESCAFNVLGAEFIRDVAAGEMVIIEGGQIRSIQYSNEQKKALCSFEFVYFARPDSVLDGQSVYISRRNAGKMLAKEHPAEADLVIAVPDSGTVAAIGYAEESKIPFGEGLIKNRYVGRTFIQPDQKMRELSVRLKLNVLKENIKGKRIVLIDDSIVRGTTSGRIVEMLKAAGAAEVHLRVCSPPVKFSCYFGIDTPTRKNLVGATHSIEEIRKMVGADSLGYLSIEGLLESIHESGEGLCSACFSGDYPMEVPKSGNKYLFEKR